MKAIRFLPLVYLIGVHGFVFFAPYVALVLAAAYAMRKLQKGSQATPVPVRIRSRIIRFRR